jgi:hypothetical protein
VMLPPQQGRDDSLRARLAQGREANVPKPINAWGTGREEVGFATDSPLESDGFEPSVPRGDGIFEAAPFRAFGHCPLCEKGRRLCESEQGSESRFAPTSGRCLCGSSIGPLPLRYLRSSISARVVRAILISSDS